MKRYLTSLSKRSTTKRGLVDEPERHIPAPFTEPAVRQISSNNSYQSSDRSRRIWKEFQRIQNRTPEYIQTFVSPQNISFSKVILQGPENTPYRAKYWLLHVEFESHYYPDSAPNVRFHTPIYYVNISGDGRICHEIFTQKWARNTKMIDVFSSIVELLKTPNFCDALAAEKLYLHKNDPLLYESEAAKHANKHAFDDLHELKRQYLLDDCFGDD